MTVQNNVARNQYSATSGQTVFVYDFGIEQASVLRVYRRGENDAPDDAADLLTLTTDYTVTGVGVPSGGTVVLNVGADENDIITIESGIPADRDTSFTPAGIIKAQDLNIEFDKQTLIQQRVITVQTERTPKYRASAIIDPDRDIDLPILDPNTLWVMNSSGTEIIKALFPSEGAASLLSTFVTMTDETAKEPNSFPLSPLPQGFLVNNAPTSLISRTITGTANQITLTNGDGISGNPVIAIAANPILTGTAGMGIPQGTTAQRVVPSSGIGLRYNTTTEEVEYWDGSDWQVLGAEGNFVLKSGDTMTGPLILSGDPAAPLQAATKEYVDAIVFNIHPACLVSTTGNLAGYTYDNGASGVGATLTAGSNGAFSTDGVSPPLNARVLVPFQTNAAQNGIYVLSQVGDGSNPAILTRAPDYNVAADMQAGDRTAVIQGTAYALTTWMMTQVAPITVGTTDITWQQKTADISNALLIANNLSDVQDVTTSRTNIDAEQIISGRALPTATVESDDKVLIQDDSDSDILKTVTAQSIADLAGSADATTFDVTQVGHGFSVGDWLYLDGATYELAQADDAATAEVVGVVSAVADVDNFTLQMYGHISGLSSLVAGSVYYLSTTTPGEITDTAPIGNTEINKPVLVADSTTSGFVVNYRGNQVSIPNPGLLSVQVFTSSGTWNKPTGVNKVQVILVGGGASGSGTNGSLSVGSGGGAGGACIKLIDVSAISSETVTVGAGGSASTTTGNGNNGGTTSFGSHCSASGGTGGSPSPTGSSFNAPGGNGTGGDINLPGQEGGRASTDFSNHPANAWGGAAPSEFGGKSVYLNSPSNNPGKPGLSYGGGGSGGFAQASNQQGGVGAPGIVVVYEYA